jgi:hypothetical protein
LLKRASPALSRGSGRGPVEYSCTSISHPDAISVAAAKAGHGSDHIRRGGADPLDDGIADTLVSTWSAAKEVCVAKARIA